MWIVGTDWGVVPLLYGFLAAAAAMVLVLARQPGRGNRTALLLAALVLVHDFLLVLYALWTIPS